MSTDDVAKGIVKAGLSVAPAALDWLTSGLVTDLRSVIADAIANGNTHLAAATQRDQVDVLETVNVTLTAVVKVLRGVDLDATATFEEFVRFAIDPTTRRRVRALLSECQASTDERIAMLAVGCFVGAAQTSLQERLDWALRSLFPDDADTLGTIYEMSSALNDVGQIVADESLDLFDSHWKVTIGGPRGAIVMGGDLPRASVGAESLRALDRVHCIQLTEDGIGGGPKVVGPPEPRYRRHMVRLLPLGSHLHANLSKVDWREIAKRRRAG